MAGKVLQAICSRWVEERVRSATLNSLGIVCLRSTYTSSTNEKKEGGSGDTAEDAQVSTGRDKDKQAYKLLYQRYPMLDGVETN